MRVKSVVLDGFKSYAHRRELSDLSPHFNAITGLNGSGKSNIFDAICFVMGITNLKRMRADDPRELIFRAGTTGVHAARVTIEFINDDPATAPPGYSCEEYPIITVGRQIKLGGKQQFFLNNTVSMQSRVKRFFESISLNVDNPHFMVLQGTVHKLIGMRSSDMLSLIEEAVGTKAFDHRRRTAETLIRNKEKKIQEIDENIQTQIGPMLEAMKADQEAYRRYLSITEGLEEKRRFRRAYEHAKRLEQEEGIRSTVSRLVENIEQAKAQLQGIPAQEDQLTRRLMIVQESLHGPCEEVIRLHEEEGQKKKEKGRLQTEVNNASKRLSQLQATLKSLEAEEKKLKKGADVFQAEREKREALVEGIKAKREEIAHLQQSLLLLKSGIRAGATGLSLEEEKQQLEVKRIQLEAALGRHQEALEERKREIESMVQQQARHASTLEKLRQAYEDGKKRYEHAEREYRTSVAPLLEQQTQCQDRVKVLRRQVDTAQEQFQRENGGRSFELSFDRRAASASPSLSDQNIDAHILGRVGELVVPKEDQYARALVVGAQQQLLRVVVDHDSVAEIIIHSGLRQRTSFLALNKIQVHNNNGGDDRHSHNNNSNNNNNNNNNFSKRAEEGMRLARQLGGFAYLAKDLVNIVKANGVSSSEGNSSGHAGGGSRRTGGRDRVKTEKGDGAESREETASTAQDQMLHHLADFIFGQFLVCSSLEIAEQLAYTPGVRIKAVTLDGEIAEPNGIMTGGSTANIRDIFAELKAFGARKAPVQRLQAELQNEEAALRQTQQRLRQVDPLLQAFRQAEENWEIIQQRWQQADGGGQADQQRLELEAQREKHEKGVQDVLAQLEAVRKRRVEVEKESSVDVAAAQKDLKKKLSKAEEELTKMMKEEEEGAAAYDRAIAEAEERAATLQQRQKETQEEHEQSTADLRQCQAELEQVQRALEQVTDRLQQTETTRKQVEKEIEELQEDLAKLQQRRHAVDSIIKNGEVERQQHNRQLEDIRRHLREDLRQAPWLEAAKEEFGDVNGPYYFSDVARTTKTLQELAEAEAHTMVMSKKVNQKSSTVLYEDRKREYEELVKQREALGQDKEAIQACIKGIEHRKWHALDRMVGVVSSVFGKLFETCLPGATAALVEERDELGHLSGLGVRVIFHGKAKESLSELSGGQRSLLALCLILAILRVRQAPIYILDEVDAALDPSHTQNIGIMLHTYFPNSQFLLVSLKDGMFNNADVLYHVRNTQGYSEVTRVSQQQQQQQV